MLNERCVGCEEGSVNIGRCGLHGNVAIGVVLRIGRGEVFGASEGLRCRGLGVDVRARSCETAGREMHTSGKSTQKALMFNP